MDLGRFEVRVDLLFDTDQLPRAFEVGDGGAQTIKGTMKILADKEKVKIKDMDYETVMVEGKDMDIAGAKTTVRLWFAKDKGIVKAEFVLQTNEVVKLELTQYTEAK